MNFNNYVVIMAGGIGTRFWPFSRTSFPKQFHDVLGVGKTMLQQTAERFKDICPPENIYVVTSQEYIGLVKEQLPFMTDNQVLAEPCRRNTAPCIGYAAYKIAARNPQANLVVAPADHIILKEQDFVARTRIALEATAQQDVIVTLGITPTRPDTGYGYIQFVPENNEVKKVKAFREKPNLDKAIEFVESGEYVWNAGIFVWNVQTIKRAFETYLPDLANAFEQMSDVFYTSTEQATVDNLYDNCQSISIDNGVMEQADNVHVVLSDIGWSDLGTWKSLHEVSDKDDSSNAVDGKILVYDTQNCIIKTPYNRLVVVQGLDGYIVAEYDNVLLICQKEQEQRVKEFVAKAETIDKIFV
jgi:mannose-1-phosphate guanylyltransferase